MYFCYFLLFVLEDEAGFYNCSTLQAVVFKCVHHSSQVKEQYTIFVWVCEQAVAETGDAILKLLFISIFISQLRNKHQLKVHFLKIPPPPPPQLI